MRNQHEAFIQALVERWMSSEPYSINSQNCGVVQGCNEQEIEEIRNSQKVTRLPLLYIEFLKVMGKNTGGLEWWLHEATYPTVLKNDIEWEPDFFNLISDLQRDFFLMVNVKEDDPIVYGLDIDEELEFQPVEVDRLSSYLVNAVETSIEWYEEGKKRRSQSDED